ncbi:MAG: DUF2807 domain-containing protein [Cyclobacteriaceae bacterium]|nr:DUF2807 domain-containing protein [Cyclobacteriaceae bacterium]
MKHLFFVISLIISTLGYSQKSVEKFDSFDKIDVFGPFEVELIKADKNEVVMDYRGFDRDNIISEVSRGELQLKLRNKHYMNEWTSDYPRSRYVKVTVYYTELTDIKAQAGAEVYTVDVLKSRNLALQSSMGAEMRMDVLAKNLITKVTMGGIMDVEGKSETLDIKANMGGVLKASHLESKLVYVSASMGAEVDVRATDEIEINAGFGAIVNYTGDPSVRHTTKNFGAEVRGN